MWLDQGLSPALFAAAPVGFTNKHLISLYTLAPLSVYSQNYLEITHVFVEFGVRNNYCCNDGKRIENRKDQNVRVFAKDAVKKQEE